MTRFRRSRDKDTADEAAQLARQLASQPGGSGAAAVLDDVSAALRHLIDDRDVTLAAAARAESAASVATSRIQALEAEVQRLREAVADPNALATIGERIDNESAARRAAIEEASAAAEQQLLAERSARHGQVEQLRHDVAGAAAAAERASGDVRALDGRLTEYRQHLDHRVAELDAHLLEVRRALDRHAEELVGPLAGDVQGLRDAIAGLRGQLDDAARREAELRTEVAGVRDALTRSEQANTAVASGLAAAGRDVAGLRGRLDGIDTEIAGLGADLSAAGERLTTTELAITELRTSVTSARQDVQVARIELEQASRNADDAIRRITALEHEVREQADYETEFSADRLTELERLVVEVQPDRFAKAEDLEQLRARLDALTSHPDDTP